MKGKIVCLLVVSLIFNWGEVNGSDLFDDVANDLTEKNTQKIEAMKHKGKDSNEVFKTNAEAYAEKFKQFLQNFHNGDRTISKKFENLDLFAWEGHYLYKVYFNDNLRSQISLHGTLFQNELSNIIDSKNKFILRNIDVHFSNWISLMLIQSQAKPDRNMEKIRVLYTEALLALEDVTAPEFKEFEVSLVFFYQMLKRLKWTEAIHQDPFILAGYSKLVNKHFNGVGFSGNEVITKCCRQKSGLLNHVQAKLKLIQQKMNGNQVLKDSNFNDVSMELMNLYYIVFEKSPVNFEIEGIQGLFGVYFSSYFPKMKRDADFCIVKIGEVILNQLFNGNSSVYKHDTYPLA